MPADVDKTTRPLTTSTRTEVLGCREEFDNVPMHLRYHGCSHDREEDIASKARMITFECRRRFGIVRTTQRVGWRFVTRAVQNSEISRDDGREKRTRKGRSGNS